MTTNKILLIAALAAASFSASCNLTGGIDNAKSREDQILDAQAKMDNGDCDGAVTELNALGTQDDRSLQMLGSAYLCSAGANVTKVDSALGSFDPNSSTGLTVVGTLANKLIPAQSDADTKIASALAAFGQMSASSQKQVWQIYGNVVRAATALASATGDQAKVVKADVSVSACNNVDCSTTNFTKCTAGGLSDAQAKIITQAITDANTAAGSNSSLGSAQKLASQLNALLGNNTVNTDTLKAQMGRCVSYNNLLAQ